MVLGRQVFKARMRCPAEAAPGMQAIARDGRQWFEEELTRLCGSAIEQDSPSLRRAAPIFASHQSRHELIRS